MNRILVLLFILIVLSASYFYTDNSEQGANKKDLLNDSANYFATNLEIKEFDQYGVLKNKIYANSMAHYEERQLTSFKNPKYVIFPRNKKQIWEVTSQQGEIEQKLWSKGLANLTGDIKVKVLGENAPFNVLSTEHMMLNLDTMLLFSRSPILIQGDGYNVKGIGLDANINKEQVILKSNVEGIYETSKIDLN